MSTENQQTLLGYLGGDDFKPFALTARRGWYDDAYLVTRDPERIRDIAAKVIMPEAEWAGAEFPEEIEDLTIWTDDHVISVHENHESGTSVLRLPRNPPTKPDRNWESRS